MRSDARQNRERIVAVARAELSAGRTPGMAEIARAAGVGQGTLYRHFPTWHDLLLEVHLSDMDKLAAAAPDLLERHPPLKALELWLDQLADYGRLKRGLSDAMHALIREKSAGEAQFPNLEPFDLLVREIQLHFSYINPFTQARAAELIASGRVAVEPLISRTIPLGEAVETIASPARAGEVKVVVIPGA